jgi:precorrin-2 C20-methyltransferase / precorrin-3B C17-methyltransferase
MKLGRTFTGVRAALATSGRLDEAHYVERASCDAQRTARLADVEPDSVPYFAVAVVPSRLHADTTPTARAETAAVMAGRETGDVTVVGLGPGARDRLTPEAAAALAVADDVVGYATYTARVPPNPRQRVHASDNKVESERAAFALDLARSGRRVAVVSSGDPGVFAMASAVVEVAAADYPDVPVHVVPGVSAAQAVAARVGAPLGHDYAMISLSDRLKPWDVVVERLVAAARADLAIAIYNPRSAARPWQVGAARDALLEHRSPETPVVLGRDVGGSGQRITITTLGELDPELVDMRTLIIIGSSTTRVVERGGRTVVFTPRHYTP